MVTTRRRWVAGFFGLLHGGCSDPERERVLSLPMIQIQDALLSGELDRAAAERLIGPIVGEPFEPENSALKHLKCDVAGTRFERAELQLRRGRDEIAGVHLYLAEYEIIDWKVVLKTVGNWEPFDEQVTCHIGWFEQLKAMRGKYSGTVQLRLDPATSTRVYEDVDGNTRTRPIVAAIQEWAVERESFA